MSAPWHTPGRSPRASAIIPVFNLRAYLAEAVESVLAQRVPRKDLEVIVVDDGSTDGSAEVVSCCPDVRVVQQPNRGPSAARNAGLRIATGRAILFLDGDDRLLPDFLPEALAILEARPEVSIVHSRVHCIDAQGVPLPAHRSAMLEGQVLRTFALGNPLLGPTAVVRRGIVDAIGPFDEGLRGVEDWDYWLRAARTGARWACVNRALAEYRIRSSGLHGDPGGMAANRQRLLQKFFADVTLPPDIRSFAGEAWFRAELASACEHYAVGRDAEGLRWLRQAFSRYPARLGDPRVVRQMCRLLLPVGSQNERTVQSDRRHLLPVVRRMLGDLLSGASGGFPFDRRRTVTWLAYWRTVGRLARKAAWARIQGDRSAHVA